MDRTTDANAALDSEALIQRAAASGYVVSTRMLETFRAQGLLPRPVRSGHRGRVPVWTHPDGTDQQLLSLLGWRHQTKDPNVLCVLLWLDGYPIPAETIRAALTDSLQMALDLLEREISAQAQQDGLDPDEDTDRDRALGRIAGVLAAKRGAKALPRRARVAAADRAHAIHMILRTFGLGQRSDITSEEAETVERVLGVTPRGRNDGVLDVGPWLTGPAEDLFAAAEAVALPTVLRAVTDATEVELETARQIFAALFRYLPLLARMTATLFDEENYAGLAGLRQIDRYPEIVMLMVPSVLGMLRVGWHDNLMATADALSHMPELAAQAHDLLEQSARTIEANLSGQPADVQLRARRIIRATLDGHLDVP